MAKARRWTHPQKKVGKEPLWGSPFTLGSSLGLHSSLSRLRRRKEILPTCCSHPLASAENLRVPVGTRLHRFWKRRADPKCTFNCANHPPTPATKPQPTRARPPPRRAPSPAFLPRLQRSPQLLLTCGSFSLPLPLPSLCTGSRLGGSCCGCCCCCGCCFSCCK